MKHLLLCLCLLVGSVATVRADVVTGRFVDAASGEPLSDVEFKACSFSEITITFRTMTSDSLGRFSFTWSGDNCWLEATCVGYHPRKVTFAAFEGNDTLSLGDIKMKPSEVFLNTAVVTARAKRFVMRGDTVVFNPEAFNLSEGARLDELIKQLPGVTEKDGQLYWMDKPVRILVNGEEMFANNTLLQQRLPAEAVDRIKAYNKANKQQAHSGRDDGSEDHVLDIQVKPGFLEKWYGTAEGAYQTEDGYLARLDAMYLSTANPLMAYGNFNNINENTFFKTFGGSGWGSSWPYGRQQFGSTGYKHQWNTSQGEKQLKHYFSFNIQGNHSDGWGRSRESEETFMPDGGSTFRLSDRKTYAHQVKPDFSFRGEFQLDSVTWLYASGGWNYDKNLKDVTERNGVYADNPYTYADNPLDAAFASDSPADDNDALVSRSLYRSSTLTKKMETNAHVGLERLLPHDASLKFGGDISYTDTKTERQATRDLRYYDGNIPDELRYETDYQPTHSLMAKATTSYKAWLCKALMIKADYAFKHNRDFDRQDHAVADAPGATLDDPLADPNSYRRRQTTDAHSAALGVTLNVGNFSLMPALNYSYRHESLNYVRGSLDIDKRRDVNLWQPNMTARWKITRGQTAELTYRHYTYAPDLLQTVDYTDNTNPLFVIQGNPLLKNTHTDNVGLSFRLNKTQLQRNFLVSMEYERNKNPRANMYFYNAATGAYRQKPANVDDGWKVEGRARYEQGIGDFIRVQNSLQCGFDHYYGFLTADYDATVADLNLRKRFYLTERPAISFTREEVEVSLSGRYTLSRQRFVPASLSNQTLTDYGVDFMARYKWRDWTVQTRLEIEGRSGYTSTEMNRVIPNWSLELSRKVLKGKGTVKLECDDLLNKDREYYAMQSATERSESFTESLHHWVRIGFTYKFDAKGSKKSKR